MGKLILNLAHKELGSLIQIFCSLALYLTTKGSTIFYNLVNDTKNNVVDIATRMTL